jgi:signal transduction histidine kinase
MLFRSYLVIVGGLIVTAAVLDYGLEYLQPAETNFTNAWIDGNLALIETQLTGLPASEWPTAVAGLQDQLGFPVRVFPADHVVQQAASGQAIQQVFDAEGRTAYLKNSHALNAVIQVGPLAENDQESALVRLIPPLFYLAVFVFVGLWLWPLVCDLNVLTDSARSFAADYRQPINTVERVSRLRELAGSFDAMSARIHGLIRQQKELTGALSHEVRTPLARIKFALAVSDQDTGANPELASISQDVQEIEELISTMLNYARLDYPDRELDLQHVRVDTWLAETINSFRPLEQGPRIGQQAPAEVACFDPGLIRLALSNLLVNACRYADTCVMISFSITDSRYTLSVEDDGQGIPESERDSVFKAFTRLDDSRNRETGGHGLGLAIVARIANLHGGTASASHSALGGAKITINWMAQQVQAEA